MGMSTHVYGFRPPDAKWKAMKAAFDSCTAAKIPIPKEISQFFEWGNPDEAGVEVNIAAATREDWPNRGDSEAGIEIDLTKLPKDLTIIRFVNSY